MAKVDLQWYVVRAVAGQEKKVKAYLETELVRHKMEEKVAEVLIPMEKYYEVRNGKKKVRERNFFPGYVLVSCDLSDAEVVHLIKSVPGVLGFLGVKDGEDTKPQPLRQSEVNRILGKVEGVVEEEVTSDQVFYVGEEVKVIEEGFSGFTGTIQEIDDDKKKLKIVVTIFGRNQPMELSYTQVEKVG